MPEEDRYQRLRLEILTIFVTTKDALRKLDRSTEPVAIRLALARAARALHSLNDRMADVDDEELMELYREASHFIRDSSLVLLCLLRIVS